VRSKVGLLKALCARVSSCLMIYSGARIIKNQLRCKRLHQSSGMNTGEGVGLIRLKTSGERSQREGQSDNNCYDCKYLHAGGRSCNLFTTDHSTLIQCATQRVGL
jgi:hypothetical protein